YGAQNRLDLYYPSDRTLRTMVVFLYDTGDALLPNRVFYTAFAERLCDLGYIVAVPDYRSYDDGHGQGAYIATQVVLTDILEKAQLSTSCSSDHKHDPATQSDFLPQIEGLLLLAGVYSDRSEVDALVKRPSPMQLVCDHSLLFTTSHDLIDFFPRLLFIHGEQDHIVPAETSVQMYNLLGQILPTEDVDVRMRIYKKLGHSIHENARLISRDVRQFIEE
ncbi:Alpha/Beta hydrolase protein, partial [Syncephalastrum racemosum]